MPGPIAHTAASAPEAFAHASADQTDTHSISPPKQAPTVATVVHEPARPQLSDGVRQRNRQRPTLELHVNDPEAGERGTHRRHLAVQRAADDGHAVERIGEFRCLLGVPGCDLPRRVGQLHHVRVRLGGEPETAGQVHVEDVEASGAESEVARLRVHHHLVAERDRARQPWVRNTGRPVHLDPRQAVVALQHRRDRAAAEAKRHAPPPAGRA